MKATFYQKGESIDYINTTEATIEANTVIAVGKKVGVAGNDIKPGEKGSLMLEGVYRMAKNGESNIAFGANVFFDGTGIKATGTDAIGIAVAASGTSENTVLVKIG